MVRARKLFSSWDKSGAIHVMLYSLFRSSQPVGDMCPNHILVAPFAAAGGEQFRLWGAAAHGPGDDGEQLDDSSDSAGGEDAAGDEQLDNSSDAGGEAAAGDELDEDEILAELAMALCEGIEDDEMAAAQAVAEPPPPAQVSAPQAVAEPPPPAAQVAAPAAEAPAGSSRDPPRIVQQGGVRVPSAHHIRFGAGTLTYYEGSGDFVATCCQSDHGIRCRMTRRAVPIRRTSAASGRALGLLAAFLLEPAHNSEQGRLRLRAFDARRAARTMLRNGEGALAFFALERNQRDDEPDSEPEGVA